MLTNIGAYIMFVPTSAYIMTVNISLHECTPTPSYDIYRLMLVYTITVKILHILDVKNWAESNV